MPSIKSMRAKIIEALLLLIILLASLVTSTLLSINIFSAVYAQSSFTDQNSINSNDNQSLSNNQSSNLQIQNSQMQQPLSPSTFTNIYKQAINSTVAVAGNNNTQGMGFVYDKFGHIMTTNYIVKGMINSTVHVTFSDGNTFPAKVIGIDQDYDLAVLQLDRQASSQEPLQPLALANSTTVQIGEPVISIGNPFGLSFSISNGIVSGVDKAVPLRNSLLFSTVPNLIQTTGIINPGDAGSPLITLDGKAIGVISSVQTGINGGFSGINFAVSSNTLQKEVPRLIENGTYKHPWIGIYGLNLTYDLAKALKLKSQTTGFVVTQVIAGSPADKAGIIGRIQNGNIPAGDIIIGIDNNKQVKSIQDILNYVGSSKNVGDIVVFKVLRGGGINNINYIIKDIPVKLEQRPELQNVH